MDRVTKEKRSDIMSCVRSKNAKPEEIVRKFLFSKGFRYRKNDKRYSGKPDIVLPKYHTVIFVNGCFWHQHCVEAQIEVHEGDCCYDEVEWPQQWFVLHCIGDLERNLDDFSVSNIEIYNARDKYKNKLYDSLVPVINKTDYEQAAEGFLRRNYKKALVNIGYVDPMEVAKSMELDVKIRSITEDCSIFGQVYFRDCDTELYNSKTGEKEKVHIPARTILVEPQTYFLYNLGKVNNTIIHECVHWDMPKPSFTILPIPSARRRKPLTLSGKDSAAWDSKHNVEVESGKTARLLFSLQKMQDGETRF